jgi:hypothetical protein
MARDYITFPADRDAAALDIFPSLKCVLSGHPGSTGLPLPVEQDHSDLPSGSGTIAILPLLLVGVGIRSFLLARFFLVVWCCCSPRRPVRVFT